jgi:hypothetical protein
VLKDEEEEGDRYFELEGGGIPPLALQKGLSKDNVKINKSSVLGRKKRKTKNT